MAGTGYWLVDLRARTVAPDCGRSSGLSSPRPAAGLSRRLVAVAHGGGVCPTVSQVPRYPHFHLFLPRGRAGWPSSLFGGLPLCHSSTLVFWRAIQTVTVCESGRLTLP